MLLYAYGGFNFNVEAIFTVPFLAFVLHFDGIVAVANVRGGGQVETAILFSLLHFVFSITFPFSLLKRVWDEMVGGWETDE